MNLGTMLDSILSNIQQSRANIIVITHTIESELEDGAKKLVPHIGTGNFSRNSPKYFSHVVYTKVSNKSHKVGSATTYETNVITGSRSDIRIEDMKEPSLAPFFDRQGKFTDTRIDHPKEQEPKVSLVVKHKEAPTQENKGVKNEVVLEEAAPQTSSAAAKSPNTASTTVTNRLALLAKISKSSGK
ncbi:unnamed protein product [Sphagnum jensenii]